MGFNDKLIIYLFIGINIVAYLMMCFDKRAAINGKRRIPERTLYTIAILGGSLGVYLGTKRPLFHKSSKKRFCIITTMILLVQIIIILAVYVEK